MIAGSFQFAVLPIHVPFLIFLLNPIDSGEYKVHNYDWKNKMLKMVRSLSFGVYRAENEMLRKIRAFLNRKTADWQFFKNGELEVANYCIGVML